MQASARCVLGTLHSLSVQFTFRVSSSSALPYKNLEPHLPYLENTIKIFSGPFFPPLGTNRDKIRSLVLGRQYPLNHILCLLIAFSKIIGDA